MQLRHSVRRVLRNYLALFVACDVSALLAHTATGVAVDGVACVRSAHSISVVSSLSRIECDCRS